VMLSFQVLKEYGAEVKSMGLYKFQDANAMNLALLKLCNLLPWVRRNHPSHAAQVGRRPIPCGI
jgi:hypothetical protein